MKSASQLMYNYIDEYKDFLQDTGTCVIDNFIGMYGEKLKLTRDGFITVALPAAAVTLSAAAVADPDAAVALPAAAVALPAVAVASVPAVVALPAAAV